MKCPKCNQEGAVEESIDVDIGVGIQRHVIGCTCPRCGQIAVHDCCGRWEFERHAAWCNEAPGN